MNGVPAPPACESVPSELGEPSPQSIEAAKSPTAPVAFASVKARSETFESRAPSTGARLFAVETSVRAASFTINEPEAEVAAPLSGVTVSV